MQLASSRSITTTSKTAKTTKTITTPRDNFKPLSEYSKDINTEAFFNDYNKLSPNQQLEMLKMRKAKLYNLATFLKQEVSKFLPKNVSLLLYNYI